MNVAEKFDDLVFEYKDNRTKQTIHRFVQLKHRAKETKTVSVCDLMDVEDGGFSLLKYFKSWRTIQKREEFRGSGPFKDFILCTNVGLDVEGLKECNINLIQVKEPDDFLKVTSNLGDKRPQCYKLQVHENSRLYDNWQTASDIHCLAKALAEHFLESKMLTLRTKIFEQYHVALGAEVIDIRAGVNNKSSALSANFINDVDLSAGAKELREKFLEYAEKFAKKRKFIRPVLHNVTFSLSEKFGDGTSSAELSDAYISKDDVLTFFKDLTLAVDQPNETQLGKMIRDELGAHSKFNLLNADLLEDSFQNRILDWFKTSGNFGEFLDEEDAEKFFHDIETKLSSLISIGLSLHYPAKLRSYRIKFKRDNEDLKNFLECSNSDQDQVFRLISSKSSLLSALRVHQTLEQIDKYKEKNDSFIYIHMEVMLLPETQEQVLSAFKSKFSHHLLVIDCASHNITQQYAWNAAYKIMKKNPAKKLVVIIEDEKNFPIKSDIRYKTSYERDDDISFNNLANDSQKSVLDTKITFQGKREATSLGKLFGITENSKTTELENFGRIIDPKLVQLIHDEDIPIGSEIMGSNNEIQQFYIPRTIVNRIVIKSTVLTNPRIKDLFAISGITKEDFMNLVSHQQTDWSLERSRCTGLPTNKFNILTDDCGIYEFQTLCQEHVDRNIHWLKYESKKLMWIKSSDSVLNLIAHQDESPVDIIDGERPDGTYLTEDDLLRNHNDGICIISDVPGMGKSTILTSLSRKIQKNDPGQLIMRIDLTRHTVALNKEQANRTFNQDDAREAVKFLVHNLSSLGTDFEKQIITKMIMDQGKVTLLFDGFDEISPSYENTVIVTFSFILQPLSTSERTDFLIQFWRMRLNANDCDIADEGALKNHAQRVMDLLSRSIDQQMEEFIGVPLQTKLVAEAFEYGKTGELPESIDLNDLYDRFVNKKYEIYRQEKQCADITKQGQINADLKLRPIFDEDHQTLAVNALFDEKVVNTLPEVSLQLETCNVSQYAPFGIVISINDEVQFVHRTYAEYFAAQYFMRIMKDTYTLTEEIQGFLLAELFLKDQYKTIRIFLNILLAQFTKETNISKIKSWKFNELQYCLKDGRTAYHTACIEQNLEILRFIHIRLSNSEGINGKSSAGISPLQYAAYKKGSQEIIEYLIDNGAEVNPICIENLPLVSPMVAIGDHLEAVEYGTKNNDNVIYKAGRGDTPLHSAVSIVDNLEVVKFLIQKGADITSKTVTGTTPLHYAVRIAGSLKIVEELMKNGADVNSTTVRGYTPLHYAICIAGNLEIVKELIKSGADVNSITVKGCTPLHYAVCIAGSLKSVRALIAKGADVNSKTITGDTALHFAVCIAGNLDIVKELIGIGADVKSKAITGDTPLHYAVLIVGNVEIVKQLTQNGADVNMRNNIGFTPLHLSVTIVDNLEIIEHLIDNGADVNYKGGNYDTPLYYGIVHRAGKLQLDIPQCFIVQRSYMNSENCDGGTPLHAVAHACANLYIVDYLLTKDTENKIDNKDNRTTLRRIADETGNSELVRFLEQQNVDHTVNTSSAKGLDVVKYLVEKGADINIEDKEGYTALHRAAAAIRNIDISKYLLRQKNNIYREYKGRRVSLHVAINQASEQEENFKLDLFQERRYF